MISSSFSITVHGACYRQCACVPIMNPGAGIYIIGTDVVRIRIYAYGRSIRTVRTLEYTRRYFDLQIPKGMVRVDEFLALCRRAYVECCAHALIRRIYRRC